VPSRGFGEPRRVGGELVPEAIEIDPLSSLHQTLHIGSAEAEVPQQRAFENVFPGADTGNGGVHHDQSRGAVGIPFGKGIGDHVADVVTDDVGLTNLQRIEDACEIFGLVHVCETIRRHRRQTHPSQVRGDHGVVRHQFGGEWCPHVACVTVPVD
jgi:hypothetical protein